MKKTYFLICTFLLLNFFTVNAQVPNQFNYQAVARNTLGQAIANTTIKTKFTILDGSATGTNVYSEQRTLTTNQLGLFTAPIGGSGATSVTGNFATINWATGKKFIKVEVDPLGGTNFITIGNTEMLSVPYALYAVNGKIGPQGYKSIIRTTPEAVSGNCSTGGQKIETGIDVNTNDILDAAEISSTQYICNGIQGFKTLLKTTNEPAGSNCITGGQKIESGVDINNNNTLEATEVSSVAYTCNGAVGTQGLKSLIKSTTEPTGANCAAGGQKMESGIDANNNNILEPSEISSTSYTCNGDVNNAWKLDGNTGTTNSDFIGTTSFKPLIFKTNGNERMRIDSLGNIGMGTTLPTSKLDVRANRPQPLVNIENSSTNFLGYGINSFSQGGVGVFGQSNTGNGIVGFNNSTTQPTARFTNAATNGAAINVQGGVYSPSSVGGFNMVPIGVVGYWVLEGTTGSADKAGYINHAGDLIVGRTFWSERNALLSSGLGITLTLRAETISQYSKIVAMVSPNFISHADVTGVNTRIAGFSSHFRDFRLVDFGTAGHIPDEDPAYPITDYSKFTIELVVDDWSFVSDHYLHGTVIFYGIK